MPQVAEPTLSVTILNYNYARYLPACIESVLNQSFTAFELIIVDDKSTDDSVAVIERYLGDQRVRLVRHTANQGYVASLLHGCRESRGKYISVISADDYAVSECAFERLVSTLEAHPTASFAYSAWPQVDDYGRTAHVRSAHSADIISDGRSEFARLASSSDVLHSGTVIRRAAYDRVGGYDDWCRYSVDTNMWLALCAVGDVAFIAEPLFAYRAHASNLSGSDGALWRATEEMLRGIDAAIALFPEDRRRAVQRVRRRAIKSALVSVPTVDIFAGRIRRGWRGYWEAFRRYPVLTIGQPRIFALALRTCCGDRFYRALRELPSHLRPGTP